MTKKFFIYQHKTADTMTVFYIGKGSLKQGGFDRAYVTKRRSKFWQAIVAKHGLVVEIIESFQTEEEAFEMERKLIAFYKRRSDGGTLCNMTLGGDGHLGLPVSPSAREKLSAALSGEKHPNWGKKLSAETCRKKSESLKASPNNLKGKKLPDWWKSRIAETKVGTLNPMYGKTGSAHHNSRKVRDAETGSIYDSVLIAAESNGFKMKTLYNWLSGHRPNPTSLEFA